MFRFLCKFNFRQMAKSQADFYHANGYLVLPNIISHQEIDKLLQRTHELVENADLVNNQMFFDTKNAPRGMSFLDTASKIGYLLEVGMIDEQGKLKVKDKKLALNKIGHAMHDLDPVFERFSYNNIFKAILQGVGYIDPILAQTMVIFKNQKFGTAVDMHTDNTYIISEPKLSCIGLWIALEDATKNNGCMYAFPKSHLTPTTYFNILDETRRNTTMIGQNPEYHKNYDPAKAECLEVTKGSVILLHGDLVHFSGHNHSTQSRHAYTLHFIEGHNNYWSKKAWLQRIPELPFQQYYKRVSEIDTF
ncbi:unnamed protein product [Paramecium primaurelia]|uniref:Phytanoyl-CoA dioxygenase n=1 Tax=Paramecium primaurelia TaxID=5886 RepID=A0A8S1N178_PARPR|nr:unnamed protein product [Paramecium primaurelia]CAD8085374.1 unnamed protein product [Paramecium primaurelia]